MPNTSPTDQFIFHGNGREYFKIWLVNVLLTVVTLGIYAAWAKVRTRKYFYQSTELNGSRFDYHADPKSILKGNLVAASFALTYVLSSTYYPTLAGFVLLVGMCIFPWLLVSSLRFQLGNTSYRGLRFNFHGSIKKAYGNLLLMMLMLLVAGVMIPVLFGIGGALFGFNMSSALWMVTGVVAALLLVVVGMAYMGAAFVRNLRRFVTNNSSYGNAVFECNAPFNSFLRPCLTATLVGVIAVIALCLATLAISLGVFSGPQALDPEKLALASTKSIVAFSAVSGLAYLMFSGIAAYQKAAVDNIVWNNTTLANRHQFKSTAKPLVASWIQVSNMLLIVCSLGLFIPFARIRKTRYRLANMAFVPAGNIDDIVREQQTQAKALGDSLSDAIGLELGF